ncbi:hypothetical protein BXU09_16100 [Deinococcus sp. LM3]|nr:hypothetical protein BXU09_16100 [Deinococcus sp. LM3]
MHAHGRHRGRRGDLLPLDSWAGFRDTFHRNPRCRLIVIDLRSGQAQVIHRRPAGWATPCTGPTHRTAARPASARPPSRTATRGRTTSCSSACG